MNAAALSRRDMLRLAAGGAAALALGGRAGAAEPTGPALFRFIVVNDIHCRDERCHPWFRKVVSSMRQHNADFCLINGDLCENGRLEQLDPVRRIFGTMGVPLYATLGNHDYFTDDGHAPFDKIFPDSVNYHFEHKGWQFIGLDSTEGRKVVFTTIQPATFAWLDANLPRLDKTRPTVLCTHFPLGDGVLCRPLNAQDLLARFDGYNLAGAFGGHWHGYAERRFQHAVVTNSRCGSWWRQNNDRSPEKGYFLCEATAGGQVRRQFCVIPA